MDTFNKYVVSLHPDTDRIWIQMPPYGPITKDDAIMLAAWLVAISGDYNAEKFHEALEAVKST